MKPQTPSDPMQSFAQIGKFRVAYAVEGSDGPTILAIPGLPGSSRDFRWLAPVLTPWARVVRFDPPGFGSSPRPSRTAMPAAAKAEVVVGLMDLLGVESAVLLGHSFGCVVAAEVAARRAGVSHLVLLSPPGITAHFPVPLVRVATLPLRTDRGRRMLRAPQRFGYRVAGFPSFLTDDELSVTSLDSGAADFAAYRAALDKARRPTLIAWAGDDRQVPPRNSAALHAHTGPGPRVAFASGGHNIQKTRAVELADLIRAFLQP
jgi:pimeloyl-ACP methyl ester carboxylesterase